MDAFSRIITIAEESLAIFAISVVAIDQSALQFYSRYGFVSLLDDRLHCLLPISIVNSVLASQN